MGGRKGISNVRVIDESKVTSILSVCVAVNGFALSTVITITEQTEQHSFFVLSVLSPGPSA